MLILSRREGEAIRVAGPCRIVIQKIVGDKVRVGIEASPDVQVLPDELTEFAAGDATAKAAGGVR